MPDYQKGMIYKIVALNCEDPDEIYYGSTTQGLAKRMGEHRCNFKQYNEGKRKFTTSFSLFENYGLENCKILLVENFPCDSKYELEAKEKEYILSNKCVNKCIPQHDKKEYYTENKIKIREQQLQYNTINSEKIAVYSSKYYKDNATKILEQHKQYRADNVNKILEYQRKYQENNKSKLIQNFSCCCSGKYQYRDKSKHFKSIIHQTYVLENPKQTTL